MPGRLLLRLRASGFLRSWSSGSTGNFAHVSIHPPCPHLAHSLCSLRPAHAMRASRRAVWRPLLLQIRVPMRASCCNTLADPLGRLAPPAVAGSRPPQRAEQRSSDFLFMAPAVASSVWMALIFRTRVRSLASGLCQATGFDSPEGVLTPYLFAAALEVGGRVSNPRPIALDPCNPCPERLSACDLPPSPPPHPHPHASQLTHHAY